MAKDGKLNLNVWVRDEATFKMIVDAFTKAGFRNVGTATTKTGPGVMIVGVK